MNEQNGYQPSARRFCPKCGTELPPMGMFCPRCGCQRADAPQPPQGYQPQPQDYNQGYQPQDYNQGYQSQNYGQGYQDQGYQQPTPPAPPKAPMNKKKIIIIVTACVVAIAAILGIVFGVLAYTRSKEYNANMENGTRFLNAGNYQEAIIAFQAAIDISPRRADAYVGLGDAYVGLGQYRTAVGHYQDAVERNGRSAEAYLGLATAYLELGDMQAALATLEEGAAATGDDRLAQWAAELRRLYNGSGALSGAVSEYLPGGGTALLPGARVRLYTMVDNDLRLVKAASTDGSGSFYLDSLGAGDYVLHVDAPDHIGIETVQSIQDGEYAYTELFLMIPETGSVLAGEESTMYAWVSNALNGESVPYADVTLRPGWNNRDGLEIAAQLTTDDYGQFYLTSLPYGYYTAEVSADGYVTGYHNVAVLPEEFLAEWNLYLSPILAAGETRIVLTWGATPSDLDSHLVSEDFHVYYSNRDGYDYWGSWRANLDLDDTSSYGPETVTIYQGVDGVYTYSVYDYTNRGSSYSSELSYSGATVRVYQGDGLVAEYHVPVGQTGTTWTVFNIYENGYIETVNVVSNIYPTDW